MTRRADRTAFLDLPYRLHRADPAWVPPLRWDIAKRIDPARNPFFDHASAACFLAVDGSRVIGRIAAIRNRLHNQTHDDRVGFFGLFECIDDVPTATALFDAAAAWCRDQGLDTLRGPASLSVNEEFGLLVDSFDQPPTLMMPHNPPHYPSLVLASGFTAVKDLLVYQIGDPTGANVTPIEPRLERALEMVGRRLRVTVRPLDMGNFPAEVERIKRLYNAAWEKNWGFVPLTERELDAAAAEFRQIVVPDLVPFAEIDGEPVAFALTLPDIYQPLRANRNGRLIPGIARLLLAKARGKMHRIRILLLGVVPEFRGRGVDALLYQWIWKKGLEAGFRWAEAGWILEDNAPMNAGLVKMGFEQYRRYRIYDRPIEQRSHSNPVDSLDPER